MLKFITNMQISRRLLLAFLLAAVIPGTVITTLGITFAKKQVAQGQTLQTNISAFKSTTTTGSYLPKIHYLINQVYHDQYTTQKPNTQQLQMDLQQIGVTSGYFVSGTNQFRQRYAAATGNLMQRTRDLLIDDYSSQHFAERQLQMLNTIQQRLWPSYSSAQNRALIAISQHAPDTTSQALLAEANAAYVPLQAQWDDLNALTELIGERIADTGGAQSNPWLMVTLVALLATVAIVIGIGYAIYRTITMPLHQLAWLTRRIALGETSARARIDGNDEIYLVATSMNNMLDSIVSLIQEAQAQRDMLQGQVEKLVSEVSGIGEGDLRIQAEVSTDTLGMLADSFNYMIEELGSLVVRVKSVSSEVEKSTRMVVKRMTQLVENENRQLEGISDATSEIEQMTQANHQIAERTQLLYDVARVARLDAQVGRDSVEQAVSEMSRITENVQGTANRIHNLGERSREINEIVEVISGIAHQTNRLALDAAIQAAMAGENGKGFGAVAADIRRLAERAKDQTLLIARIVRAIREDIGSVAFSMQDTQRVTTSGSRLTQEAGVALESIFAAVEHQAREIECINQLATQQVQSSHRIVQIMQTTSETTRQNSSNTQNASQRMEQLARLVEQLRASVEAFKLRENQPYQAPRPNIAFDSADSAEKPLTISGVFRTVNASIHPRRPTGEPVQYAIDNYGTGQRIPLKPLYSIPFTPPRMPLPIPDFTYPSQPNFPPAPPVPPFQTIPPAPALPAAPPAPPETANDYATYTTATAITPSSSRLEQVRQEPSDADDWATTKRAIMHRHNQ
jgi:Methyl-accepting chemotaxis protein